MLAQNYQDFLKLVIYQIYPRSFKDSNHDGIGDLKGVIEKLDYLQSLGVNAIWLCPCYKSPNDDHGYDISDYRDIMDEFGNMNDMKRLIAELHDRNMKLILDLVPNHTSTAHKWFRESRLSKDNPYNDYYYWFDEPQNDWKSCFGGSAWEYDEVRGQYYLHSYAVSQADLNWECPAVVREMQDIVDFWVDLRVDGFRCDVIDQISKDWKHNRNMFGPRLHEFIHDLFGRDKTAHLFTVGECWCNDLEEVYRHTASERGELSTVFQFDHMGCGREDKFIRKPPDLREVRDIITNWETLDEEHDLLYTLFTDNHDQPQFISRVTDYSPFRYEAATMLATMFYLLRGVPVIYQGQEFGMTAGHYDSIEDFDDIESINFYHEFRKTMSHEEAMKRINFGSRDNTRRPMCWDDSEYGGFSDHKPWITLHSEAKRENLKTDLSSDKSVFRFYQKLLQLRASSKTVLYGTFELLSKKEDHFCIYKREWEGEQLLVVCNFEQPSEIITDTPVGKPLLTNDPSRTAINGCYAPYEAAVFRL